MIEKSTPETLESILSFWECIPPQSPPIVSHFDGVLLGSSFPSPSCLPYNAALDGRTYVSRMAMVAPAAGKPQAVWLHEVYGNLLAKGQEVPS